MTKRVAFILGSPRKNGNTNVLARQTMSALDACGVASVEIDAPRLGHDHPGCVACFKCQQSETYGCHVDDALGRAVAGLVAMDAVVLATPLYWFSYPAQVKMVIDRMFSLIKFGENHEVFSPLAGKPLALLATAGGELEQNLDLLETQWRIPALKIGSPFLSCLYPHCLYPPGMVAQDAAAMEKAADFGRKLAGML